MINIEKLGCFGSILSFQPKDETCIGCPNISECGDTAYESLLGMRELMDVSELQKKFDIHRIKTGKSIADKGNLAKKVMPRSYSKLTASQLEIVNNDLLPVKPRKLIGSIFRRGFDGEYLLKSLKAGVNPFEGETPKILEQSFSMLLDGGFSKKALHTEYLSMGMANRTAHAQVSLVVATLEILDVVKTNKHSGIVRFEEEVQ